ncbi:MAG: ABC transporter substrate-binding protein [Acidimicrobiia bacterium]
MRKRLSLLVLVLVMAMVAASCGDSSEETTTTASSGGGEETTTTAATDAEIATDIGADPESKVIKIGLLADLTGLFAALVTDITDAQKLYWDNVNAAGGIDGWTVELVIEDTNYNNEQHQEKYAKLREEVLAISQSTGSPTSVTMLPNAIEDNMLFIPLSWYSGWGIPEFDQGVALEQNTNYCIEAMNIMHFIQENGGQTVALATFPSDYGFDAGAGVKMAAEFYGMEIVYDGDGAVIPGQDQTPVIQGIVGSGADWTFLTTNPSIGAEILAGSVQAGYGGMFTGSVPTYDFRLLDSAAGPLYDALFYQSAYNVGWGADVPGNNVMMEAMAEAFPDRRPSDSFITGWNESITMHEVLKAAIANGDLTRAGVVAAANMIETVDFGGSAPNQSYAGTPDEYVVREIAIFDPDLAVYTAAGGAEQTLSQDDATTGSVVKKDFFVGDAAAEFEFTAPCFEL